MSLPDIDTYHLDGDDLPALARYALAAAISDTSEEQICAGWEIDCEHRLWDMLHGGPRHWGFGDVPEERIALLRLLSQTCGGWWAWSGADNKPVFLRLEAWEKRHAMYRAEVERFVATGAWPDLRGRALDGEGT